MKLGRLIMCLAILLGLFTQGYSFGAPIGELLGKTLEVHLKDGKVYQGLVIAETEDAIILKGKALASQEGTVSEVKIPRAEIAEVRLLSSDTTRTWLFWLGVVIVVSGLVVLIRWALGL